MGAKGILKIAILLLSGLQAISGNSFYIEDILKPHKTYMRPENTFGHTYMNVSVVLNNLEMATDKKAMTVSGELIQEWEDEELRFLGGGRTRTDAIGLYGEHGSSIKQLIWLPDLTPSQTLVQYPTSNSDFLRINGDGRLTWTKMFHATVPCDMELAYYPFESYNCILMFHSLGYDTEELRPQWSIDPAVHYDFTHVSLPCEIDEILTEVSSFVTVQRARHRLEAEIIMECYSGWTIKHTVVPFVVTVTIAYMVFFLHPRSVATRLFVSLISFVIAMLVHETTYKAVPKYPYTMAIEVFTGTCLGFIFVSAVQSVVVERMARLPDKLAAQGSNGYSREPSDDILTRGQLAAQWLDRSFRVLYPVGFLVFNIIYWIVLMTHVAQLH